jgi:site-specific DNA-methyltransferase (adenine-specific)
MVSTHDRVLDEFDTYIRYYEGVSILKKVQNKEKHFMSETASSQKPFGLRTYARPDDFGELTLISSGGTGPFKRENVPSGIEWIDKWKLMTSIRTQGHAGQADKDGMKRILSRTEILPPSYICTESYIVINVQNDEKSINNVYSYIKTKFVRFLMSLVTSSQAINKQSFVHVPIQDFSRPWTDEDLYKKYELSDDEIKYIESLIKPME